MFEKIQTVSKSHHQRIGRIFIQVIQKRPSREFGYIILIKFPREVLGFYTEQEGSYPGSQPTVNSQFTNLSIIAPFWYKLDDKRPGGLIDSVTAAHKRKVIQSAHEKHVRVYLVVHNLFYETLEKGKQVASKVLDKDKNRIVFIQTLRNEMK